MCRVAFSAHLQVQSPVSGWLQRAFHGRDAGGHATLQAPDGCGGHEARPDERLLPPQDRGPSPPAERECALGISIPVIGPGAPGMTPAVEEEPFQPPQGCPMPTKEQRRPTDLDGRQCNVFRVEGHNGCG
jgi:hypothetical protein